MTNEMALWANPLFIRHVRSRLRQKQLLPSILAVVLICGCIVWWVTVVDATRYGGVAFAGILALQAFVLLLVGTSSVATAVAHARDVGMLDFHRISPQSPLAIALGFVLGAPVREYVLVACTLPFWLYCGSLMDLSPVQFLTILLSLILAALLYHSFAALLGLVSTKPREASGGAVTMVILVHLFARTKAGLLTIAPAAMEALEGAASRSGPGQAEFFGLPCSALFLALAHQIPLLAFFLIALVRKMRRESAAPYSKPLGVVFQVVIGLLVLGDVWGLGETGVETLPFVIALYSASIAGMLLSLAVTPRAGQFAKGVRRARKDGLALAPPWSDLATNWVTLCAFTVVVVGIGLLGVSGAVSSDLTMAEFATAIAIAAFAVLSFGSAKQYLDLTFGKAGHWYFALLLFVLWGMPIAVGPLLGLSGLSHDVSGAVFGLSPLMAIGVVAADWPEMGRYVGVVGVVSSALVAIVLLWLCVGAEKRAAEAATDGQPGTAVSRG